MRSIRDAPCTAIRILIVAPDEPRTHELRRGLESLGYAAGHARSVEETGAYLACRETHVVVVRGNPSIELRAMVATCWSKPLLITLPTMRVSLSACA